MPFSRSKKRRPCTEAEKQVKREKSKAWWASEAGKAAREVVRQRRIAYNKDPERTKERLKPEARKAAGERLAELNRTRERSEEERAAAAVSMSERVKSGQCRRGPMTKEEKEFHRQRMLGNQQGLGQTMSEENKTAHSERMKANNPMWDEGIKAKMLATIEERYGKDFFRNLFKRLNEEGWQGERKTPITEEERAALSKRVTANNPMKDMDAVRKSMESFTPERRRAALDRMKKTWEEGKITPAMFLGKGNVRPANKTETVVLSLVERFEGKFVGDGKFWLAVTESGIRRNPDFIFGSGKAKTALLVHGVYWHQDESQVQQEITDYLGAGWNLMILWTKGIKDWMLPSIEEWVLSWLAESSASKEPVLH